DRRGGRAGARHQCGRRRPRHRRVPAAAARLGRAGRRQRHQRPGVLALTHDPERVESQVIAPAYAASKAAVTVLTTQYAKAWADIRFNAVDPGYTATDLNGHSGTQTVTEGTD